MTFTRRQFMGTLGSFLVGCASSTPNLEVTLQEPALPSPNQEIVKGEYGKKFSLADAHIAYSEKINDVHRFVDIVKGKFKDYGRKTKEQLILRNLERSNMDRTARYVPLSPDEQKHYNKLADKDSFIVTRYASCAVKRNDILPAFEKLEMDMVGYADMLESMVPGFKASRRYQLLEERLQHEILPYASEVKSMLQDTCNLSR